MEPSGRGTSDTEDQQVTAAVLKNWNQIIRKLKTETNPIQGGKKVQLKIPQQLTRQEGLVSSSNS